MKKMINDPITIVFLALSLLASIIAYPSLPSSIVVHWGPSGEANNWMNKSMIFILFLFVLALYLLFSFLPSFDKRGNLGKNPKTYRALLRSITFTLLMLYLPILFIGLGFKVEVIKVFTIVFSILLIIMGNHYPQLKPNSLVGIKTKWTLADEDTWRASHKVGGYASIIAGALLFILSILLNQMGAAIAFVVILVVWATFSITYSYIFFKSKHSNGRSL